VTHIYSDSVKEDILSVINPNVSKIILDGEILVYNNFENKIEDFGKNK